MAVPKVFEHILGLEQTKARVQKEVCIVVAGFSPSTMIRGHVDARSGKPEVGQSVDFEGPLRSLQAIPLLS